MDPLRVFCTSDVHIDYAPNMDWVRNLSNTEYLNDALIVAGDGTCAFNFAIGDRKF